MGARSLFICTTLSMFVVGMLDVKKVETGEVLLDAGIMTQPRRSVAK